MHATTTSNSRFLLKALTIAFLLTLLAGIAIGQNCQSNLLTNPGFENGTTGWNPTGSTSTSTDAFSGNASGEICNGIGSFGQIFTTTPGTEFTASVVGRVTGGAGGNFDAYARLRFLNSSYTPLADGDDIHYFDNSIYQSFDLLATAPANAAFVHLLIWKEQMGCLFIDELELCESIGGLSDLVPVVQPGVTSASNNEALTFDVAVQNIGTARGYSGSFQAFFSDDDQWSNDDEYINSLSGSFQPDELDPGQISNTQSRSYIIPSNNTFNGTKFLLIVIDYLDNHDESDETNNVFPIQVQISTPTGPNDCVQTLGQGDLLCSQKNGNTLEVFLENNLNVTKYILDGQGTVTSIQNAGTLVMDSILVEGNQVVKKLANGNIVYTKTIPQSVLDSVPLVQAATELTDGTIVLAGYFQEPPTNPPTPPAYNDLVLVKTDANLNPLQFKSWRVSNFYNPFQVFNDVIVGIYPAPNAAFDVFYSQTLSGLTLYQRLLLNRFSFNDPQSFDKNGQAVSSRFNNASASVVKTRCNSYRYIGPTGFASQKGHFFGTAVSYYDVTDLSLISSKVNGSGSVDYYGAYDSWTFRAAKPDSLNGSFQYRPSTDPIPPINLVMTNQFPPQLGLEVPFFNYEHAARMDNNDIFLFGKNNTGEVFVEVPTDCNSVEQLFPDITGSNPGPTNSGDYQPGGDLPYFYGITNEGGGGTTAEIAIKPWLSTDTNLDGSDIGFPIFYAEGLMAGRSFGDSDTLQLPANLAPGSYYLILELDADNANTETNEGNNVVVSLDPINMIGGQADLEIVNVTCPNDFPQPGQPLVFDVEIKNNSTVASALANLFFNRRISCVQCVPYQPIATLTIPSIPPGSTSVISYSPQLPDPLSFPGTYCFTGGPLSVSCISIFDFFLSFEQSQFPSTDGEIAFYCKKYTTDLEIEIIPNGPTYGNDGLINMIFRVKNNGATDAYNVTVNAFNGISLPNANPDNIITSDVGFNVTGGDIQWSLPVIPANSSLDIHVTYNALGLLQFNDLPNTYTVEAGIASGHLVNDPSPSNNDDQFTFTKEVTSGDIDLELNLTQPNASPAQWSNYEVIATLTNNGDQTATGVEVSFEKPNGVVYVGGNEYTASQGSFNPNGNQIWSVGSIPAGGSATLTVNYFLLANTAPVAYSQVIAANETDMDSTPNNGTPPTVNEDDEASSAGGSPDPNPI